MIILEEIERMVVDIFLIDFEEDIALLSVNPLLKSMGILAARMYNSFVSVVTSTDNRKVYMFRFITMAKLFRSYRLDIRSG